MLSVVACSCLLPALLPAAAPPLVRTGAMPLLARAAARRTPPPPCMLATPPLLPTPTPLVSTSVLLADYTQSVIDTYYFGLLVLGAAFLIFNNSQGALKDAKAYDERGEAANRLAADTLKRKRAAAREKVRRSEPLVYERLQAEKRAREGKRQGWKIFGNGEDEE